MTILDDHLTVGRLKEVVKDLPDEAPVFYERIQDSYFKLGDGWAEHSEKRPHPEGTGETEYLQVFTVVRHMDKDGKKEPILFLTAHY